MGNRISIAVLVRSVLMNLMNVAAVMGSVAWVWGATLLTFHKNGWMGPEFSLVWQAVMYGATIVVTGIICYAVCLPFIRLARTEAKRKPQGINHK
jgi:hypothetical protein